MNVGEITQAILTLAGNRQLRLQMGENGYQRVAAGYRMEQMLNAYGTIYREFAESMQKPWTDNEVEMTDHQSDGYIGER